MKVLILFIGLLVALSFAADLDGDGFDSDFSFGEFRDCCDTVDDGCYDPFLINPGAWEIPNNGQEDRCIDLLETYRDNINNNLPCDQVLGNDDIYTLFTGPDVEPSETERAMLAMDICEFKDDDDDPSWGFARQENMIFSLADGTRNGFDYLVDGPNDAQVSILRQIGNIFPANGKFFLAISTGVAQGPAGPNFVAPDAGPAFDTLNTDVDPPTEWSTVPAFTNGNNENLCARTNTAIDSIMGTFAMQQPTNMNAWSMKVLHLESDRQPSDFGTIQCPNTQSWLVVLKNDTGNNPDDRNVAIDMNGNTFNSQNPSLDYFTSCIDYNPPSLECYDTRYRLIDSGFDELYSTRWMPIGSSATSGEPFQLKLSTWDRGTNELDSTFLFDDYIPVAEARTVGNHWGYQFTSDIELSKMVPDNAILDVGATSVSFSFVIKNNGPEVANDITINFTPPKGTSLNTVSGDVSTALFVKMATGGYENNSFYKFTRGAGTNVGESVSGVVTLNIEPDAPQEIQFKLSVTSSSIEKIFNNNYQIQMIYRNV